MAKKRATKSYIREGDQWLYLITGRHIRDLVKRAVDLYGPDFYKAVENLVAGGSAPLSTSATPDESPYTVLGILPDASDALVKASFRAAVFEYHPDTGSKPDTVKYQKVVEARDTIVLARKILKEKKEASATVGK